ncbi:MAG: AAA family ATPase [Thermodesulfobacteriota bacterium]
MIQRIEIENFMSHRHTVIEPAEGLTVIVGENNTGKSALISALQVLCRNASGDYMMRHGERQCRVKVVTGEGHEIEWKRKNRVVSYNINGRDIHRLGGSVPDQLHDLLRLPLVETENEPFDIHFGEQKKPIFLLNESPARRATFFASSSDTIKLIEMQNHHRRKVSETRAREAELVRREAELAGRLEKLAPVDAIGQQLEKLDREYEQIIADTTAIDGLRQTLKTLESRQRAADQYGQMADAAAGLCAPPSLYPIEPLQNAIAAIYRQSDAIDRESGRRAALDALFPPPGLADTGPIWALMDQLAGLEASVEKSRAVQAAAKPLEAPPRIADTTALSTLIRQMEDAEGNRKRLTRRVQSLSPLAAPPPVKDCRALGQLTQTMADAKFRVAVLARLRDTLAGVAAPPEAEDVSGLQTLIQNITAARTARDRQQKTCDRLADEMAAARQSLKQHIERTGVCPTCGQAVDAEQFIENTPMAAGGHQCG